MRLATLNDGSRDGALIVVSPDGARFTPATPVAPTLQAALDTWATTGPQLEALAAKLAAGAGHSEPLNVRALHSPLPRAYEWVDGSAFIQHILLVRKARGAEPPPGLETDPLVYQGGSGVLLPPTRDLVLPNPAWGLDFEAEVCVVLDDTPQGVKAADAHQYIRLIMLANDVTYRALIPAELGKGFGFFQSKPATAFSPFAVTPAELGDAWREGRVHLPMLSRLNGAQVGDPDAGVMHFSFGQLIEHICKTRAFTAGTILGSGTVSNVDRSRGISCLAERRMIETIDTGKAETRFMQPGDHIEIEMLDGRGRNVFGTISQKVVSA